MAQTWAFGGSTATLNATNGQQPAPVALSAYHNISSQIQFGTVNAGSGTINVSDALNNNGDVAPNSLPADNATAGYTAIIYISFYNGSGTTVSFGTNTPQVQVTNSAGFGSATTCELDVYSNNGGSGLTWHPSGASAAISGNSVTMNPASIAPNTLDLKPGQQVVAIACH